MPTGNKGMRLWLRHANDTAAKLSFIRLCLIFHLPIPLSLGLSPYIIGKKMNQVLLQIWVVSKEYRDFLNDLLDSPFFVLVQNENP